jgi:hypothetical protein
LNDAGKDKTQSELTLDSITACDLLRVLTHPTRSKKKGVVSERESGLPSKSLVPLSYILGMMTVFSTSRRKSSSMFNSVALLSAAALILILKWGRRKD